VTTALVATIRCDTCPAVLVVDKSALHARNMAMVAREKGWRVGDKDVCPDCIAEGESRQGVLAL
jgi:RNA:NAD 2'-phosphotransferase (TPT1/KptA family)